MYAFPQPEPFERIFVQLEFIGLFNSDRDYLFRFYRQGKSYFWFTDGYGDIGKQLAMDYYGLKEYTPHNRIFEWFIDMEEQGRHLDIMKHETT